MGTHLFTQAAPLSWCDPLLDRELPALAFCAAAFLVLFIASEVAKRFFQVPIEVTRKGVHVGAGLVTLALPHLFESLISLVVLALGFFTVMWSTRRLGLLSSVHRVDRNTSGAVIYPLGICALLLVSKGRPILYEVPLLVMVLADPAACLGGIAAGKHPYVVFGQRRTVEGSASFFVTAFATTFLLLIGRAQIPALDSIALAALVAGALVFVEAWSVDGWDNFTLPVAGFVVLSGGLLVDAGALRGVALCVVAIAFGAALVAVLAARREREVDAEVREVKP